jgi:hypothetical protein
MFALVVSIWFTPSKLPNIWSALPLCSNHASVLHGDPFCSAMVCPASTIQAQIIFRY